MKRILLFLSFLLINWMVLPSIANAQEQNDAKPTPETIQRHQKDSRRFKHLTSGKKQVNAKLAAKLQKVPTNISVPDKSAYGYLLPGMAVGLSTFNMSEPTKINTLYPVDIATEPHSSGGAYAEGKYYSYYVQLTGMGLMPVSFGYMDVETGDITDLADYSYMGFYLSDMTYDYSTKTMFALYEGGEGSKNPYTLVKVNLKDGQFEQVAPLEGKYFCIAATYDGILYGINEKGELVVLNKQTGRASVIGNTGIKPQFYQSMDFDHTDGTLYWAATDEMGKGYFCVVNLKTGKATVISKMGDDDEVVGLYIPYTLPANDAPNAITDLKLMPNTKGASEAAVSWKNPSVTFDGGQLTGLTKVEVYRDDELVYTASPVHTGQALFWKDTEVTTGMHVYRVIPYNSAGKGATASTMAFVGRDVPAAVSNISLEKVNNSTVKLTWKAPDEGRYGGWIDAATLKYKIIRYPDEKVMAEGLTDTECTDNTLTALNRYSYLIEVSTSDGEGDKVVSENIVLGPPLELPYVTTFKDNSETDVWTVLDNDNDGYSWELNSGLDGLFLNPHKTGADLFAGGVENRAYDDWLISPELKLEKGKAYRMILSLRTVDDLITNIKVTLGKGTTVKAQIIDLGTYETSTNKGEKYVIALPDNLETGNYNIGFRLADKDLRTPIVQINSVAIEENMTGHVTGKVSNNKTGVGVEAAVVSLTRNGEIVASSQTDASGNYTIEWIKAGDYELSVDRTGYEAVKEKVRIEALKTITENFSLTALPAYALTGKVTDVSGNPMEGAEVEISGYDHHTVYTDAQGVFSIPSLYRSSTYYIAVIKPLYYPHLATLSMQKDENLGNISLRVNAVPPVEATAETTEETINISWSAPVETNTFRYDSDTPSSQLGIADGDEFSIFGSVYKIPAIVRSISWVVNAEGGPHETVNVFVMDLDEQGRPTSNVLFSEKGIKNTDGELSSHTLSHPVKAPNGFMVAISYDKGFLAIATAESTEEYPFLEKINYYSPNYRSGNYIALEGEGTEENLMIRAEGIPLYEPMKSPAVAKASSVITKKYNVYRVKEGDENTKANWKKVASGINDTSYADNTWSTAESGVYKYAVSVLYNDKIESVPVFTDEVFKDMNTEVSIHVNLADGKPLEFVAVILENIDRPAHSETLTFDENEDIEVTLLRGYHKVTVASLGYNKLIIDRVDFNTEKRYDVSYTLYPEGPTPYNLKVDSSTGNSCTVSWNNKLGVFDDFEGHKDFAINSPGEIGWTYIDGDGVDTEEIDGLDFPNAGSKIAYIVMNPSLIENSGELMLPYSGSKYLTSVIAVGGNDDYLISPELKFEKDFILSFYAKSYTDMYGLEQVRIGYSLGGNKKEDFIWLRDEPVEVSTEWANYIYSIPAEAKYVTINCVSDERFFFMLDDVFIGSRGELENRTYDFNGVTYSVYLDDGKVGTTTETTYTFTGLSESKHTIGVQANYGEGFSEIITLVINDLSSIKLLGDDSAIQVYPNPVTDRVYIHGQYDKLCIYDINGTLRNKYDKPVSSINVTNLNTGIYMIKIISGDKTLFKKLIVKNN